MQERIELAILHNNIPKLILLLQNYDQDDNFLQKMLSIAISNNKIKAVALLLNNSHIVINSITHNNLTHAIQSKNKEIIKLIFTHPRVKYQYLNEQDIQLTFGSVCDDFSLSFYLKSNASNSTKINNIIFIYVMNNLCDKGILENRIMTLLKDGRVLPTINIISKLYDKGFDISDFIVQQIAMDDRIDIDLSPDLSFDQKNIIKQWKSELPMTLKRLQWQKIEDIDNYLINQEISIENLTYCQKLFIILSFHNIEEINQYISMNSDELISELNKKHIPKIDGITICEIVLLLGYLETGNDKILEILEDTCNLQVFRKIQELNKVK